MIERILLAALSSLFSSLLTAALLWWRFDKRLTRVEYRLDERGGIVQELDEMRASIERLTNAVQSLARPTSPVTSHGHGTWNSSPQ